MSSSTAGQSSQAQQGFVYDEFACNWFSRMSEATEAIIKNKISLHGGIPEDPLELYYKRTNKLGLTVETYIKPEDSPEFIYYYVFRLTKHIFMRWFKEHSYLFEGITTFRTGPFILGHPGRPAPVLLSGKMRQRSIDPYETDFGVIMEESTTWFRLINNSVRFSCWRNKKSTTPEWIIYKK